MFQKLIDSYVFDNKELSQEQFKNKVHKNAARIIGVLDRIVDLLSVE